MDFPTIIVASIIAAVFVLIVAREIINKKKGKRSCSCGSCGACNLCNHKKEENEEENK